MRLLVQYTAQMRTAAGRSEDEVELADGSTLAALLGHLGERLDGDAATHLVTASGHMQCGLLIVVNDAAIASHQASTLVLRTGDVVTLLPPIAGG